MTVKEVVDYYNEHIDFITYYNTMFPGESIHQKTKCKLHNEVNGHSFSYTPVLKIWTCFGQCNTSGKVVEFHKRYTKKSLLVVLDELKEMFPFLHLPTVEVTPTLPSVNPEKIIKDLDKLYNSKNSFSINRTTNIDELIENMFYLSYRKEEF